MIKMFFTICFCHVFFRCIKLYVTSWYFTFISIPVIICLCSTRPCNRYNVFAVLFKWFPNFIWFIHWITETIVPIIPVLGYSSSSWSSLWILSWQQFVIMNNLIEIVNWYPLIVPSSKCWLDGWICLYCTKAHDRNINAFN